ncbi:acyl-CoA dehydrogenase family protein [Caulobacter sp. 3R27C2-B]|uniref:acyl-CoA dehydrogenase family protein n=1 Tax=Caulobacter sp. 3R27C2-B TaxID=2502219 RepID=UPI0010F7C8D8|nr:acyl-CoA dehydrogenase family protein [Caulobacter sp. 3R27C2-B]
MTEQATGKPSPFRDIAREWISTHFPAALARTSPPAPGSALSADQASWRAAMGSTGWGVPTWPAAYGGGGLSEAQAGILAEELARAGAYNPIGGMGVMMFGPTLLEYGSELQKLEHIPRIAMAEVQWCQGFSEPGAGSDLASLQCRAEDKGDHFVINGQKIWTSGAQYADWCFCLVRTDTSKKHEGISFVLFSMDQPGVEVRPIPLIAGNSPFCETFFTDAIADKSNLVGPLNGGWTIAKRLLQFERAGISSGGAFAGVPLPRLAQEYVGFDATGRLGDHDLRARIVKLEMEARALQLTAARSMLEAKGNAGPSAATSIMKNVGSSVVQMRAELCVEILGNRGLGWEGDGFTATELGLVRG